MASEIYTRILIFIEEIKEEKIRNLQDYIIITTLFKYIFKNNKNLEESLKYIDNTFLIFLKEANREHNIYEQILLYMKKYESITDLNNNMTFILSINYIFENLEQPLIERMKSYTYFITNIINILNSGILTNNNYKNYNYQETLSEEEYNKLRKLIPNDKH